MKNLKYIFIISFLIFGFDALAQGNAFEQIVNGNFDNSISAKLRGRITLIATALALVLFIFTTGISTLKNAIGAWRGGEEMNIVKYEEIMRKLTILVVLFCFPILSGAITGVVSFLDKSTQGLTDKTYVDVFLQYGAIIVDYENYAYYYKLKAISNCSSCPGISQEEVEYAKKNLTYYYLDQKLPPSIERVGFVPAVGAGLENMIESWKVFIPFAFNSALLGIAKFITYAIKYGFLIYFSVILALAPLAFALSIPEQLKNGYVKIINSLLVVGLTPMVLNVIDAFFMEGLFNLVEALNNENASIASGVGDYVLLESRNEIMLVVFPIFCITIFGLFFVSSSIASKLVGASSDDGSLATRGLGALMSVTTLAIGGKMLMSGKANATKDKLGKR